MKKRFRGVESRQEQDSALATRDTRTLGRKTADWLRNPQSAAIVLFSFASAAVIAPALADVLLVAGITLLIIGIHQPIRLPFRMPMHSRRKDPNDIKPGSNEMNRAQGIFYLGNEMNSNEELWVSNTDMRTHVLIFGTTGSGKTEALVSLAFNALVQGSGLIYVDGKGDNSLYAKIFALARRVGREDDLLVVNYMTGARDIIGPQSDKLSNTMNPFAIGSSSMLSNLVVSLMDDAGSEGGMWKGRAISFIEALMKPLVYMRDHGGLLLDVSVIREFFVLEALENLAWDKKDTKGRDHSYILDELLEPMRAFLLTLPGYERKKKGKQAETARDQHGYITMQLTRIFGSLSDTYGHIVRTTLGEVDFYDAVMNRRILVVLLPALEKSPDELANLGKMIVSSLRAMMSSGLGSKLEGRWEDVIESKPTHAPTPFVCILDEYGYYAVKGFAVVAAQARSLGFSAVFAGQDLPSFKRSSEEEAASTVANTNIKIFMKLEDPQETWKFAQESAGEALVHQVSGFHANVSGMTINYTDMMNASLERRQRLDLMDLKAQREGEAHILFRDSLVRARLFYANPPKVQRLYVNHFLKVECPSIEQIRESLVDPVLQEISRILYGPVPVEEELSADALPEDLRLFLDRIGRDESGRPCSFAPQDCAAAAFVTYHRARTAPPAPIAPQEPGGTADETLTAIPPPVNEMPSPEETGGSADGGGEGTGDAAGGGGVANTLAATLHAARAAAAEADARGIEGLALSPDKNSDARAAATILDEPEFPPEPLVSLDPPLPLPPGSLENQGVPNSPDARAKAEERARSWAETARRGMSGALQAALDLHAEEHAPASDASIYNGVRAIEERLGASGVTADAAASDALSAVKEAVRYPQEDPPVQQRPPEHINQLLKGVRAQFFPSKGKGEGDSESGGSTN